MKRLFVLTFLLSLICAAVPAAAQIQAPEDMVLVPAGKFWMGRHFQVFKDAKDLWARSKMDDQPANNIYLDEFYIDIYEVTNADFASYLVATGAEETPWHWPQGQYRPGEDRNPVVNVSWFQAAAYCEWAGKRLPTEAEWEMAARGGLDRNRYEWGDEFVDRKEPRLFAPQSSGRTTDEPVPAALDLGSLAPVGTFEPNGYGIYDMVGSTTEWVSDWYYANYYPFMPKENPSGPETGRYRSLRGANWMDGAGHGEQQSVYYRNFSDPKTVTLVLGFRCAQTP